MGWKIVLDTRLGEYLYEIGAVRHDLSLEELRARPEALMCPWGLTLPVLPTHFAKASPTQPRR